MWRRQSALSPGRLSQTQRKPRLAVARHCPHPAPRPHTARRLVEHFGGVQNIFKASLTGLEATGIQTVSAQSMLALGEL